MEKINKIIDLEQAKNRTPNALPYYMVDKETGECALHDNTEIRDSWGGYCVDFFVPVTASENEAESSNVRKRGAKNSRGLETNSEEMEYVDLGLPSKTCWASRNLGAPAPEMPGDYYAWGELETKSSFTWGTYNPSFVVRLGSGANIKFTKYCNYPEDGYEGYTDTIPNLEPEDDVATHLLGQEWHMPTLDEWNELVENTTITAETISGQDVFVFTSNINGKQVIFPTSGWKSDSVITHGERTHIFLSRRTPKEETVHSGKSSCATCCFNESQEIVTFWKDDNWCWGHNIRAVKSCACDECAPEISWATNLFDTFNLEKIEIPLEEPEERVISAYWVRYKNLMLKYHWLVNKFIPSINFYMKCTTGFKSVVVKNVYEAFENGILLYPDLGSAESVEKGTIIGITDLYDEFIEQYKEYDNAVGFYKFVNRVLNEGLFEPVSGTTPYMDVNFSLTSTQTDLGVMSPLPHLWEPKKKYYLGERVLYNNDVYLLTTCNSYEKYELTGELLTSVINAIASGDTRYKQISNTNQIDEDAYSIANRLTTNGQYTYTQYVLKQTDENNVVRYYFIYPFYKGEFNETTKVATFDTINSLRGYEHWSKVKSYLKENIPDDMVFTGTTESKLLTLKRKKATVDDYGNILNCIVPSGAHSGAIDGEILYMFGITNEVNSEDGSWHGDELVSIKYRSNEEDTWTDIVPSSSLTIASSDFLDVSGVVEFTYFIGSTLNVTDDGNGNITKTREPLTGVKYTEQWDFKKETITARIDGMQLTIEYVNFTPQNYGSDTINLDIQGKTPIYSNIEYYGKEVKLTPMINAPYYKEEDLLGIQNINTLKYDMHEQRYVDSINAYIQRGSSASFERHNILGEIKTFADLENYRNNFFDL